MNFSNLKWYLFAVITVFLCFYLIPETQYNASGWAIGIVTSLLVAFFIFLGIAGINSLSELSYFNSENPNAGNPLMYIVPIATFLFGSIIINSNFSGRLEKKSKRKVFLELPLLTAVFLKQPNRLVVVLIPNIRFHLLLPLLIIK
ncbi:hypothetical protein ACQ9BO_22890 [Flavobacterium sp. P21]|uniref:hypothetical protein n=1 Tax=Flavobacterium sp. P21 TaxID=3423948 RepID=UPI003D6730BD